MDAANTNLQYGPEAVLPPTPAQLHWLKRGLGQPGGKLPLFTEDGQRVPIRTVRCCLDRGWAEPWFMNPVKPDWIVCKLTERGRELLEFC